MNGKKTKKKTAKTKKKTAKTKTKRKTNGQSGLRNSVLAVFREVYGDEESDAEVLAMDPSDFDRDPAEFLEKLEGELTLTADAREKLYEHGGTVRELIQLLAKTGAKPPTGDANIGDALDGWFSNVVINTTQPIGDDFDGALLMMEFMMRKEYRAVRKYAREALAKGSFVEAQRVADKSGLDLAKVGGIAAVMQVAIDHDA